jgi:excisionase family DNA binding protein
VNVAKTVEEYLGPNEIADRLRMSRSSVIRAIGRGELGPVARIGRLVRVPASGINRWLASKSKRV